YFGMFRIYMFRISAVGDPPVEAVQELRTTVSCLARIQPDLGEARIALAYSEWLDRHRAGAVKDAFMTTHMRAAAREGGGLACCFYGNLLVSCGHPRAGLEEYQRAKALLPDDPMIQFHLGLPRFVLRDFDGALKEFRLSVALEPRHSGGHYWIGRVYEE